eukprot:tig00000455_g1048.t1
MPAPYDAGHLDEVFALVQENGFGKSDWRTALVHEDVEVQCQRHLEGGKPSRWRWFRIVVDLEVPAGFAAQCFVARSRGDELTEFVVSDGVTEVLEEASWADPDGLGGVAIHETRTAWFGWRCVPAPPPASPPNVPR